MWFPIVGRSSDAPDNGLRAAIRRAFVHGLAGVLLVANLAGDLHFHPEGGSNHTAAELSLALHHGARAELELAATCEPGAPVHAEASVLHRLRPCTVCLHRLESRVVQPSPVALVQTVGGSWRTWLTEASGAPRLPGRSGASRAPPSR